MIVIHGQELVILFLRYFMTDPLPVNDGCHLIFSRMFLVWLNHDGTDGNLTSMRLLTIPSFGILQPFKIMAVHNTNPMLTIKSPGLVIMICRESAFGQLWFIKAWSYPLMENLLFLFRCQLHIHQVPVFQHILCDLSCEVHCDDLVDDVKSGIHRYAILTDLVVCQLSQFLVSQLVAEVFGYCRGLYCQRLVILVNDNTM